MKTELLLSLLRGVGLALRLALSLFVVAAMGVEVFGTLSLLLAVVAFAAPLATMGLHYRNNREIVDAPARMMAERLRDRAAMNLLSGGGLALALAGAVVGASLSGSDLSVAGLTGHVIGLFLVLAVLEVVLADMQNFLNSCRLTVLASVMLFVRSALWIPPMMAAVHFIGWSGLEPVLWFWLGGCLSALAVLAVGVADWPWRAVLRERPVLGTQFDGFRMSAGIWLSDVCVAASPVIERSLLLTLLGPATGGSYIFFWTLANGVLQVMSAAVVFPSVPVMVSAAQGAAADFRHLVLRLCRRTMLGVAGSGVPLVVAAAIGLDHLGRPELAKVFHVLPLLLVGTALFCVAELMRLALYALRRDRALVASNIAMVAMNTLFVALTAMTADVWAVALVPALVAGVIAGLRWHWITRKGIAP